MAGAISAALSLTVWAFPAPYLLYAVSTDDNNPWAHAGSNAQYGSFLAVVLFGPLAVILGTRAIIEEIYQSGGIRRIGVNGLWVILALGAIAVAAVYLYTQHQPVIPADRPPRV